MSTDGVRRLRRRVPVVLQATTTDCGAACMSMVLAAAGRPVSLDTLREDLGIGRDGVTALDVRDEARRHGLAGKAVRATVDSIGALPMPLIAHWENNHFLVVERVSARWIWVADPAIGRRRLNPAEFAAGFTGIALVFRKEVGTPPAWVVGTATPSAWRSTLWPAIGSSRRLVLSAGGRYAALVATQAGAPVDSAGTGQDRQVAGDTAAALAGGSPSGAHPSTAYRSPPQV